MTQDHPRDCEHGRQWGKCDTCDLIEEQQENAMLQHALRRIISAAGNPDAAQGCRLCIYYAQEALELCGEVRP